jgi:Lon protease-like protein
VASELAGGTAQQARFEALPLFPLRTVLFPLGLLPLKIFEARYTDMVSRCLRQRQPFGVVCLKQGAEVRAETTGQEPTQFEAIGTLASIDDLDSAQAGILHIRCRGGQRFELDGPAQRQADGLWLGSAETLPDDLPGLPAPACLGSVEALARAITQLQAQGEQPFAKPYRLDDAGWVANRWCELLPLPLPAKQMLMALPDAATRLSLVHRFLTEQGVVAA